MQVESSKLRSVILASVFLAVPAVAQTTLSTDHGFGMDDGEITPNGALGIVRENTILHMVRIYDMATGVQVGNVLATVGPWSGAAQDCVEVTNTRAVVTGSSALVIDLSNPAFPILGEHLIGESSRDIGITPDGTLAVIRGGNSVAGSPGGLFVLDLATGALLATHPGEPGDPFTNTYPYDVDSVAVTNTHAVCTSLLYPNQLAQKTRVTIWDLHPVGGGVPVVVYETTSTGTAVDQAGGPHDLAITPDGQYAAVRSEAEVGLYRLSATPSRLWHQRLFGTPGPMGMSAMDSIEVTNDRIVTISRYAFQNALGAQLDLFDIAGNQWFSRMRGDPHDLALTPAGTRALVRTTGGAFLFDIATVPAGQRIQALDRDETLTSTNTFFSAGYDSITTTNERAIAVARVNIGATVRIYDISNDSLAVFATNSLPEKPVDVAISPDHTWASVVGTSYVQVYDFTSGALVLENNTAVDPVGWFPWCDGVELDNQHLVAWGYSDSQSGWVSVVDLFSQPSNYCTAGINSTGVGATIHATGSQRIASNNLKLWGIDVPSGSQGSFVYAVGQAAIPFGGGTVCVSGQRYKMPTLSAINGIAAQLADYTGAANLGGAITAGTTWNFQLQYRDIATGVMNFSDGLSITFTP